MNFRHTWVCCRCSKSDKLGQLVSVKICACQHKNAHSVMATDADELHTLLKRSIQGHHALIFSDELVAQSLSTGVYSFISATALSCFMRFELHCARKIFSCTKHLISWHKNCNSFLLHGFPSGVALAHAVPSLNERLRSSRKHVADSVVPCTPRLCLFQYYCLLHSHLSTYRLLGVTSKKLPHSIIP